MNYDKVIEAFQKDAEKLGANKNSVEQLILWIDAHKQAAEEFEKETPKYKEKLKDIQKSREKISPEEKEKVWETMRDLSSVPKKESAIGGTTNKLHKALIKLNESIKDTQDIIYHVPNKIFDVTDPSIPYSFDEVLSDVRHYVEQVIENLEGMKSHKPE